MNSVQFTLNERVLVGTSFHTQALPCAEVQEFREPKLREGLQSPQQLGNCAKHIVTHFWFHNSKPKVGCNHVLHSFQASGLPRPTWTLAQGKACLRLAPTFTCPQWHNPGHVTSCCLLLFFKVIQHRGSLAQA